MALYGLASLYEHFSADPIVKRTVKCRYCKKKVNEKVCCSATKLFSWDRGHPLG